ncbi:MAG: DUF4265 domain-containing protein, partial [Acidovorax sp.]
HGHSTERLWASKTDKADEYVLENAPFFVREMSFGDVVSVRHEGEALLFDKLIRRGGHSTYRLIPVRRDGLLIPLEPVLDFLKKEGCAFESGLVGNMPVIVVDMPPHVSADRCYEEILRQDKMGLINFEVAHDGHPS